jgi:hypothetical protein
VAVVCPGRLIEVATVVGGQVDGSAAGRGLGSNCVLSFLEGAPFIEYLDRGSLLLKYVTHILGRGWVHRDLLE